MPREKFKTLTEQMFYILLCLCEERCGIEILDSVKDLTDDRVKIGSGTLYDLLEQFTKEGMICETKIEGRRRSYRITEKGLRMLDAEYQRLSLQTADWPLEAASILAARFEWFIDPTDWTTVNDTSRRIPGYYQILQDLGYTPADDETSHLDQLIAAITEADSDENEEDEENNQ